MADGSQSKRRSRTDPSRQLGSATPDRALGDWLLSHHARIAEALATLLHPLVEGVVHDYRRPNSGIVAIFGGHITGRKVGDPLTELGQYRSEGKPVPDDLVAYSSESSFGKKMKSASLAVRLPHGELIGALCFNVDIAILEHFSELLNKLSSCSTELPIPRVERFRTRAPRDEVAAAVQQEIRMRGRSSQQLSQSDREAIVAALAEKGFLSRRGAINTIAQALGVTRPTVYRYLRGE
jgi:predicted transcriptional regulator YheO